MSQYSGGDFFLFFANGIPVKLKTEDICRQWLVPCLYAEYWHRSNSLVNSLICPVTDGQSLKCGPAQHRRPSRVAF